MTDNDVSYQPPFPSDRSTRISILRPSQLIAAELRTKILRGDFDGEEPLPHEPDFARQLGVSRHHLREALRLLEQDGLIRVNRGHTGGIVLTEPNPDVLARTFEGILARKNTRLVDLMNARIVVEPGAAALAAECRTETDLTYLDAIMRRRATEPIADNNNAFHIAVAAASHNDTLWLVIRSLSSLIWHVDSTSVSAQNHAMGEQAHRAIVAAIRDQDVELASRYMRQHLEGFITSIRESKIDPETTRIADLIQDSR